MKKNWKPGNMIYPLPAVLVTCGRTPEERSILTVSWVGTLCTDPPMCYISVRPERHSFAILERHREYVINLTTEAIARATDWCGVRSGRHFDKFKETGLTPGTAVAIQAPTIEESPLSIECRAREIIPLGSHTLFISDVLNVQADEKYLHPVTGKFDLAAALPIVYSHGEYFALGRRIGKFGWSVEKKPRH
ncbi:MAG: flavin reductase family protein [Odoribacteraceae bacterium]|jgi:flavin reductase (DIM6/NTAB) family NADH-FMN oxidoreductase RutF|nr:flavin reductase family protein [Odoribacteraceae bacterium]